MNDNRARLIELTYIGAIQSISAHYILINDDLSNVFKGNIEDKELKELLKEVSNKHNEFINAYIRFALEYAKKKNDNPYRIVIYGLLSDVRYFLNTYIRNIAEDLDDVMLFDIKTDNNNKNDPSIL